jgi:hypothetical protein
MIVVNDLAGDEDDAYLWREYFKLALQERLYNILVNAIKSPSYHTQISNVVIDKPTRYVSYTVEVK